MFKNLTRGGQTMMHSFRMLNQVLRKIILTSSLFYIIIVSYYLYKKTISYQWYLLVNYYIGLIKYRLIGKDAVLNITDLDLKSTTILARQFISNPYLYKQLINLWETVFSVLIISFKIITVFIFIVILYLHKKGRLQKANQSIRGSLFLEAKELKKFLKKHDKSSDLEIGNVPLVKDSETKHILITGTTGSGKSVCMMELLDQIRNRGNRAILYDDSGTFINHYYRKEQDIILNPLDERCPVWNIWQEGDDLADFEAIANSLMPEYQTGNDPFWVNAARTIFANLAYKLSKQKTKSTKELLRLMFSADPDLLIAILKGTVSEPLIAKEVEKMTLSIKSVLASYCKSLLYLKPEGKQGLFSIKRWINSKSQDSWMFIATSANKLDAVRSLISLWLDLAARSMLSLEPSFARRIWIVIDELASLNRLNSLELVLSQGRKYGVCVVTAFQDLHQLRAIYGLNGSEAILSMYNTNFCYRAKCPNTAAWMSKLTGQREIMEQREGFSYGANDVRDGVSINSERIKEPLILDTEFLNLKEREAFLILPENTPVTKIKVEPVERTAIANRLLPRKILDLSLEDEVQVTKNNVTTTVLKVNSKEISTKKAITKDLIDLKTEF